MEAAPKPSSKNIACYAIALTGLLILGFRKSIVFPGFQRVLGIDTIVGKSNVVHHPDGSYDYTNPQAQFVWVLSVMILGFLIHLLGLWLAGVRLKFPKKQNSQT